MIEVIKNTDNHCQNSLSEIDLEEKSGSENSGKPVKLSKVEKELLYFYEFGEKAILS